MDNGFRGSNDYPSLYTRHERKMVAKDTIDTNTPDLIQLRRLLARPPGILGRAHYHRTAVLVPLVAMEDGLHLLFEKRAADIPQGSEICFPGGYLDRELDNVPLDTALRETEEELGLKRDCIDVLGQLETLVSPRGIIVECFLAVVDLSTSELVLDPREVAAAFTVPVSWFQCHPPEIYHSRVELQSSYVDNEGKKHVFLPVDELGLPPRYKKRRSEWLQRVVVYRRQPDIIWGLTAAVVENLVENHLNSLAAVSEDKETS